MDKIDIQNQLINVRLLFIVPYWSCHLAFQWWGDTLKARNRNPHGSLEQSELNLKTEEDRDKVLPPCELINNKHTSGKQMLVFPLETFLLLKAEQVQRSIYKKLADTVNNKKASIYTLLHPGKILSYLP